MIRFSLSAQSPLAAKRPWAVASTACVKLASAAMASPRRACTRPTVKRASGQPEPQRRRRLPEAAAEIRVDPRTGGATIRLVGVFRAGRVGT
jgi:hypothetical protein